MRNILSALVGIILLFSMARAADNEINRTAVIVTDKDSVSVNLNRNFEDCGVDKYLVEYVEGYNPAAAVTIGVNTCYTEQFIITPYTGDIESLDIGADITGMMNEQSPITVNYTVYVIDYSIIQDTDITDRTTIYKEGGALLTLGGYTDGSLLSAIYDADSLKWYYHTEDIGTGMTKPALIYTGKNKFTLKLEDLSYKSAVSKLNGETFEGSSESTHYTILDNPREFYEPGVGNYNFEINYKENYLVTDGYSPSVDGGIYTSNKQFLVHKPIFELALDFMDRSEEGNIGANKNPLDLSWEILNNGGSIEGSTYKNSDGAFYSNPTRIKLNIKSEDVELKPVILTIHPFKPVSSSNASIDTDKSKTLRVTNVRDLRWANVGNEDYVTSNMMDKASTLLSVPYGYTNPKYGYGIGLAIDTINENLGRADKITVDVGFSPTPKDIIKDVPLEDKYKSIEINKLDAGKQENFLEKRTDGTNNNSIWSFMYYLPSKKDSSVGNQVKVYFNDIIIGYPKGIVKYSDWFGGNIHIFTYDNTIDVIDDINNYVAY